LAVQGLAVMSGELEDMADAFYTQRVPDAWESVAYPSLKPLSAWVSELTQRCEFMVDWVDNGTPLKYWVSGFFFPQAFLTGNLQNYGKCTVLPCVTATASTQ
jgi:dynein heavy chain